MTEMHAGDGPDLVVSVGNGSHQRLVRGHGGLHEALYCNGVVRGHAPGHRDSLERPVQAIEEVSCRLKGIRVYSLMSNVFSFSCFCPLFANFSWSVIIYS